MQIRTCTWHHVVERSAHVANRLAQVLIAHCVPDGGAESANQNLYLAATGEGFCTCGHTPGPGARRVLLCMSPNTHAPCTRLEPFGEKWLSVKIIALGHFGIGVRYGTPDVVAWLRDGSVPPCRRPSGRDRVSPRIAFSFQ